MDMSAGRMSGRDEGYGRDMRRSLHSNGLKIEVGFRASNATPAVWRILCAQVLEFGE
jgi:hypothetical protein